MDQQRLDLMGSFQTFLNDGTGYGIVVVRHGWIAGEYYAKNARPGTRIHVHSVTKAVTSLAFGHLLASGAADLDLDTAAYDLLPDGIALSDPRKAGVTIRHLLSMTSGIRGESCGIFGTYAATPAGGELEYALGLVPGRGGASTAELAADPGTRWDYSCAGYLHLGMIFQEITGRSVSSYLGSEVFAPIGLTDWDWESAGGFGRLGPVSTTHIGLHISARELARLGYCILQDGRWGQDQVLPPDYLREATTPQELNPDYGLGFWLNRGPDNPSLPGDLVAMKGYNSNRLYVVPSEDLVIARVGLGPTNWDENLVIGGVLGAILH
ncbi:serine hydrolase domain-containing protein [Microlunatus endophyticus]